MLTDSDRSSVCKTACILCWVQAALHASLILIAIFGFVTLTHGQNADAKPLYTFSVGGGAGYYIDWEAVNDPQLLLDVLNEYELRSTRPFYHSIILQLERTSRSGNTSFGLHFYSYLSTRRYDTAFLHRFTDRTLFEFEQYAIRRGSNVYAMTGAIRLFDKQHWGLVARGVVGLSYLYIDDIDISATGTEATEAITARWNNSGFMELHTQISAEVGYQLNPFYGLYANIAYDYEATTQQHIGVRLAVGLRLYLRKGGLRAE